MRYLDTMEILSQCGLGAVLLSEDNRILAVNETGDRLLHGNGNLVGAPMPKAAAILCEEPEPVRYASIVFGEYLCRCTSPRLPDLPPRTRMIVFRVATNDVCHDMLVNALNGITESVIIFDAEGRIYLLNDAAVNMDSIVTSDVLGKHVSEVYHLQNGQLAIPQVLRDKRPIMNMRQYYTTCFGKNVDTVSNTFPVVQNGQTLGAFNVIEDWSATSELHKQIIDLQS